MNELILPKLITDLQYLKVFMFNGELQIVNELLPNNPRKGLTKIKFMNYDSWIDFHKNGNNKFDKMEKLK